MSQLHWMVVRMYLPTVLLLVGAFVATGLVSNLGQSPYLSQVAALLRWVPHGLLALAGLLGIVTSARLWAWDAGRAPVCACGGLLGRERQGRYGPYRKCMGCGMNHALRR